MLRISGDSLAKLIVRTVQFGPDEPFLPSLICRRLTVAANGAPNRPVTALVTERGAENATTMFLGNSGPQNNHAES